MKRLSFTLIEIVMVIVIAGILAAVMMPRLERNRLREATRQIIQHLQYAQHLAMVDDIYDARDPTWFRKRWQVKFSKTVGSASKWSYTIYSDYINKDGVPNVAEIAVNSLDESKRLTGGYSAGTIAYDDADATSTLNVGQSYGVEDIDFSGGCVSSDGQKWISFDHLGRPYYRGAHLLDSPFMDGTQSRKIVSQCVIDICKVSDCTAANEEEKLSIAIEAETGYVHLL